MLLMFFFFRSKTVPYQLRRYAILPVVLIFNRQTYGLDFGFSIAYHAFNATIPREECF